MSDAEEDTERNEMQKPPPFDPDWFRVDAVKNMRTSIYLGSATNRSFLLNVLAPNNKTSVAVYVNDERVTNLTARRAIVEVEGVKIEVQSEHDFSITVQWKRA